MTKYSFELKQAAIEFYLQGHSYRETAKHFLGKATLHPIIKQWFSLYEQHGLSGIVPRKREHYSAEYKFFVLNYMQTNHLSLRQTSALFNIPTRSTVLEWQKKYLKYGIEGLKPMQRGRKKLKLVEQPKMDSEKTVQELLTELEYLRVENACLKKLQEIRESKRQRKKNA